MAYVSRTAARSRLYNDSHHISIQHYTLAALQRCRKYRIYKQNDKVTSFHVTVIQADKRDALGDALGQDRVEI